MEIFFIFIMEKKCWGMQTVFLLMQTEVSREILQKQAMTEHILMMPFHRNFHMKEAEISVRRLFW